MRRLANLYHALAKFYCFFYAYKPTRPLALIFEGLDSIRAGNPIEKRRQKSRRKLNICSILDSKKFYFVARERRTRQFSTLCRQRNIVSLIGFKRVRSNIASIAANMSGSV
jgi:hypothetical protein